VAQGRLLLRDDVGAAQPWRSADRRHLVGKTGASMSATRRRCPEKRRRRRSAWRWCDGGTASPRWGSPVDGARWPGRRLAVQALIDGTPTRVHALLENPPNAVAGDRCNMCEMVAICSCSNHSFSLAIVAINHSTKRLRAQKMVCCNRSGNCNQFRRCGRH
jgi:hypothetical protein